MVQGPYSNVTPLQDFDWSLYEGGYNGKNLIVNKAIKTKKGDKIYCHESYANKEYKKFNGDAATESVEVKDFSLTGASRVTSMKILNENEMLVSTQGGNATVVNLNKENRFFEMYGGNKDSFIAWINDPETNKQFIDLDLMVKVNKNGKGSMIDGHTHKLYQEYQDQIVKPTKAYYGTINAVHRGGFTLDIQGVRAFMPYSLSGIDRDADPDTLIGTKIEVMIDSYSQRSGFIVSHKKFLRFILPSKLANLNKEVLWDGIISGIGSKESPYGGRKYFGIFVRIEHEGETFTGLMHKTLMSDETYKAFKELTIQPETPLKVWIHEVVGDRIVFSDIDPEIREEVSAMREAQEEEEKRKLELKYNKEHGIHKVSEEKLDELVNHFSKD
jgi:hypothetical protein